MPNSVERWLQTFMCTQYAHIFEAYGYRSLQAVCHLQMPNLLAMGVPRNHSEKILENIHILKQTMFGRIQKPPETKIHPFKYNSPLNPAAYALKTVAMNANYRGISQFPEEYGGYGQSQNNMQTVGYHQGSYDGANMGMMNHMNSSGYGMQGYDASHSHMMMSGQGPVPAHNPMYPPSQQQQQQQAAYLAQQQQQYYAGSSGSSAGGGPSQYGTQQYPMQGGSGAVSGGGSSMQGMSAGASYYNAGNPGPMGQGSPSSKMVPPPHHHLRNTSGQQNPQQVADNILQMASSYPSHHTVQVPLKNRHAPYQIPRSPHYGYTGDKSMAQQPGIGGQPAGTCQQTSLSGQQQQQGLGSQGGISQPSAMMYPPSSPHNQPQPRTSPMSPLMMQSPAHQPQSLPSPGSMHSPNSASIRSPAPSPNMRSPCSMSVSGASMRSPGHLPAAYSGQQMSSPPHRTYSCSDMTSATHQSQQHCSPTSMHSPVSHVSSPYTPGGMSAQINSPPQQSPYTGPSSTQYNMDTLMDSGQGPGVQSQGQCQSSQPHQKRQGANPLQSLQKLVMLPETQVVDPKSVVSDACLAGSDQNSAGEGSKNFEGPAGQSGEAVGCSAGNSVTSSPQATRNASSNSDTGSVHCGSDPKVTDSGEVSSSPAETPAAATPDRTSKLPPASRASSQLVSSHSSETTQLVTAPRDAASANGPSVSVSPTSAKNTSSAVSQNMMESSDVSASNSRTNVQSVHAHSDGHAFRTESNTDALACSAGDNVNASSRNSRRSKRVENASAHRCNGTVVVSDSGKLSSDTGSSDHVCDQASGLDSLSSPLEGIDSTKDAVVKSPSQKHHKERLTNKHTRTTASISTQSQHSPSSNESNLTAKPRVKLVNGLDSTHVNGSASKEELIGHSFSHQNKSFHDNCILKKNTSNNITSDTFDLNRKVTLSKMRTASAKQSVAVTAEGSCALVTVNGPLQVDMMSSRRLEHSDSDQLDTDEEVEKVFDAHEGTLSKLCSIFPPHVKSLGGGDDATFLESGSDNEDFSFSDGFDLGYDSPPSEMTGDDNWKPSVEPVSVIDIDEADGIAECSEQDSDKGISPKSKGSAGTGSPSKINSAAGNSSSTRTVTRSSTGSIPKRKVDEDMTEPYKRVRRSSGANATNHVPLTQCGNSNVKEEVKVLNRDNSPAKTGKDEKSEKEMKSAKDKNLRESGKGKNCQKTPVVVLTKSSPRTGRKKKKRDQANKNPVTVTRFLPRGKDGRFIPQCKAPESQTKQVRSKPPPAAQVHEDTDEDEPLIVVQRRSSKENNTSTPAMFAPTQITSKLEAEKPHIKTEPGLQSNTLVSVACGTSPDIKASTPCLKTEQSTASCLPSEPVSVVSVSPVRSTQGTPVSASSLVGTPRKRGRPRKGEEVSTPKKKNKKGKNKKKKSEFARQNSEDDSFKTMRLSKTLNLMQNRKKKGDGAASVGGPFSPFVRVEGKMQHPSKVSVFNHPPEKVDPKSASKKKGATGSVAPTTTIQITNFSSDKTVMLPSTRTDFSPWVCALCGMRSSYRFLGDLFGPYYVESHLAVINKNDTGKDAKKGSSGNAGAEIKLTRRKSTGSRHSSGGGDSPELLQEVWIHEDCAMWSNGVYLVGSRIYGLEEALKAASAVVCACCREKGAMVGCLHKGCSQTFHYMCAVDKDCFLDVENFSMLCPKHKDKRLKSAAAAAGSSKL